jgi:nitrite reductase/ring-hydroxylating ferredoxin subunit
MMSNRDNQDCGDCPLLDRRAFLLRATLLSASATVAFTGVAHALPVVTGIRIGGEEKAYPIPAADGVQIDKDMDVSLSRVNGRMYAFNLACPHQNTAIRWDGGKGRFQCPKHKSIYTPEGIFVEGRATRGLDRFLVRKEGTSIVVNLDSLFQEDLDAEKWKLAFVIP